MASKVDRVQSSSVKSTPKSGSKLPSKASTTVAGNKGAGSAVKSPAENSTAKLKDSVTLSSKDEKKAASTERVSALERGLTEAFGLDSGPNASENAEVSKAKASAPVKQSAEAVDPNDPGQKSVDLARQFEGKLAQDISGELNGFNPDGNKSNRCADFVSSVLAESGRGIDKTASVSDLRQQLLDKGWEVISKEDAKPGDVWMTESNTHGSRHTELVTTEGGTHTIGSNNIEVPEGEPSQQMIFEREKEGGMYYGYRGE